MNARYFIGQFSHAPNIYVVAEILSNSGSVVEVKNVIQLFEMGQKGLAIRPDPVFCVDKSEDLNIESDTKINTSAFALTRITSDREETIVKKYLEKMVQVRTARSSLVLSQNKIIAP